MKKYVFLMLSISLFLISLPSCQSKKVEVEVPETIDYVESSELILDITKKVGRNTNIEAAELNLELSKESELSKKAELLMKINKITLDTPKTN